MTLSFDTLVLAPCLAAFGEVAQGWPEPIYTPQGWPDFAIDGVFDEGYREVDLFPGSPVTSAAPVLGVRLSDFPPNVAPSQGDLVVIRGVNYLVREVRPDSHGFLLLTLNRTA